MPVYLDVDEKKWKKSKKKKKKKTTVGMIKTKESTKYVGKKYKELLKRKKLKRMKLKSK